MLPFSLRGPQVRFPTSPVVRQPMRLRPTSAGLDPMRITAYAASAEPAASRLGKLLKTAGGQPLVEGRSIARCAVSTALALGVVPPATVKFLERLLQRYTIFLCLDLYAALYRRGDADRPSAGSTPQEVGVDANRKQLEEGVDLGQAPRAGEVLIDIEKLKRAREATIRSRRISAGVFTDDQFCVAGARGREPRQTNGDKLFRPSRPRRGARDTVVDRRGQRLIGKESLRGERQGA